MPTPRARFRPVMVAAIAVAAATSCVLPSEGRVGQLIFRDIPAPSVVVGDTMRDTLGVATPLTAEISDGRVVRFVPLDTNIRVDGGGFLIARSRDTTAGANNLARVIADGAGSLQTPPQIFTVTIRPDQVVRHGNPPPEVVYDPTLSGIEADTTNRSVPLQVRLRHLFTAGEAGAVARDTVVRAYYVRFVVTYLGTGLGNARMVSDARNPTDLDTTDASGLASRRVLLVPVPEATATDSVVVEARVFYRNAQISGSPVRFVVPLRRRP